MCIKLINPYNILGSYYYYHLCFSGDEIKAQKNQDAIRGKSHSAGRAGMQIQAV